MALALTASVTPYDPTNSPRAHALCLSGYEKLTLATVLDLKLMFWDLDHGISPAPLITQDSQYELSRGQVLWTHLWGVMLRQSHILRDAAGEGHTGSSSEGPKPKPRSPVSPKRFLKELNTPLEQIRDFNVDEQGEPYEVEGRGTFRVAGDARFDFGFQLTGNRGGPEAQQGHFLCLEPFELNPEESEICIEFEYHMNGPESSRCEGLCAYLVDPGVDGWYAARGDRVKSSILCCVRDAQFRGDGPIGVIGKAGALVGVALDLSGSFSGGAQYANSVTVRCCQDDQQRNVVCEPYKQGPLTTADDEWRKVSIKFDVDDRYFHNFSYSP